MSAASSAPTTTASTTPRAVSVTRAVYLAAASAIIGMVAGVLPGNEDVPTAAIVIGTVLGLLTLVCAWGLWNGTRWGAFGTFVLTALNLVAALPGFFNPPSMWLLAALIGIFVTGLPALVLLAQRSSRGVFRSGSAR